MIISLASGKGGTGKTTVAVSLALSLVGKDREAQFLDCDVEEPDAHLFLKPKIKRTNPVSIPIPQIDETKCNFCGQCAEVCAYNAIAVLKNKVLVFPELCHGCGGCSLLCPQKTITEKDREIGIVEIGIASGLQFVQGRLNIGEAMSPPVIRAVKKNVADDMITIIDSPPGTSCPVIESVRGSDFCLLVTEPTPFGLNDLILTVEMCRKIKVSCGVIINRADIGDKKVEEYCRKENIPILMRIPFNKKIAVTYSKGVPLVEAKPEYKHEFKKLFKTILGTTDFTD